METSINEQSGGTTAETPKINSNLNQTTDPNQRMSNQPNEPKTGEEIVTLKVAAAKSECAWTSLKNNIKSGKLTATQASEKAPYMVRLSDVERFLRDTPGIASIFHPAASKPALETNESASCDETSAVLTHQKNGHPKSQEAGDAQESEAEATADVTEAGANSKDTAAHQSQLTRLPAAPPEPATHIATDGTKRRRRRRRGKGGGGGGPQTTVGFQLPVLKALAGTTPQERLRITACLTELLGLVASA